MEVLLVGLYVAICIAVFRVFRIPVNQWSLSTAALVGIVGILLLILSMGYNHPYTKNARIYYVVTPIIPNVKGRVTEVPVEPNTPLKEGDILFRIDPKPYQYVVNQKKAALTEAEANASVALEEFQTQAGIFGFEDCSSGPTAPPTGPSGTPSEEAESVEEGGIEVEEGVEEVVPEELEEGGIEEVAPEGGGAGVEEAAPPAEEEESSSGGVGPG